jgi:thiol-disulfide isomerase/thioredoxin
MKRKSLWLITLCLVCFSCKQEEQNVINGKIDGLEIGDRIILSVEDPDGSKWIATDSAIVDKAGEFTLKTKISDNYVQLTYLRPGEKFKPEDTQAPRCFLESYAELSVTGNTADWFFIKKTGGLYNHPDMSEINHITDSVRNIQKEALKMRAKSRETNDTILQKTASDLIKKANSIAKDINSLERIFVKNNPDVAYSAALLRYDVANFDEYEKTFYTLSERVQNSPAGIMVRNHITSVRASEAGATAPDFTLKALDGQEITLSNFKGKYVLIDFWGSWCGPCRESSPLLVELYGDLKKNNANIEFIGIACNEQGDEMWKKAIENDNLAWIHLNDSHSEKGKSISKKYAIVSFPTSILISPEGKIQYREHPLRIIPKVKELFGI